jgi:hypothetical protein
MLGMVWYNPPPMFGVSFASKFFFFKKWSLYCISLIYDILIVYYILLKLFLAWDGGGGGGYTIYAPADLQITEFHAVLERKAMSTIILEKGFLCNLSCFYSLRVFVLKTGKITFLRWNIFFLEIGQVEY